MMNYSSCNEKISKPFVTIAPIFLRVVLGVMFLMAGIGKFSNGTDGLAGMLGWLGPLAGTFAFIVAAVELIGGAFLIIGLFTRISSILLSIIMIVATITVVLPNAGFMGALGKDIMYLAGLIVLLAQGPGKFSLDGMLFKTKKS